MHKVEKFLETLGRKELKNFYDVFIKSFLSRFLSVLFVYPDGLFRRKIHPLPNNLSSWNFQGSSKPDDN